MRKIFGPVKDGDEYRRRKNKELEELMDQPNITQRMRERKLRWAGHVARMSEDRSAKKVMESVPVGKRPLGRPRTRWEDEVKRIARELEVEEEWKVVAQNRDRWRQLVKAAHDLQGP